MRPPRKIFSLFLAISVASALFALYPAIPSYATTLPDFTLPQLTQGSDVIVTATVQKNTPSYDGQFVVTETTLKVDKILKGKVGSTLILRQRGGVLGDFATYVPGMPRYEVGEQVLVFLEEKPGGRFVTTAFSQGKFTIEQRNHIPHIQVTPHFYTPGSKTATAASDPPTILIHDHDHPATQLVPLSEVTREIAKWVRAVQKQSAPTKAK